MLGSIHRKAGGSLKVRGVPSGRTSVPLKLHVHPIFQICVSGKHQQITVLVWGVIPATACGSE